MTVTIPQSAATGDGPRRPSIPAGTRVLNEDDVVDAQVLEATETSEYKSGWHDCLIMRLLQDRLPGFAIVRPREQDPFEVNREVLAEYGITHPVQMYAVAMFAHSDPRAHPTRTPKED